LPGVEEASVANHPSDPLPMADRPPGASSSPTAPARERETVICHVCGDIMQRAGSCHACPSCGATSGCS
jgi:ribonucleoside-diphosphate reductase alpha chain